MWKPLEFANALRKHWGGVVTSGVLVGLLGIWQGTGHAVLPAVYWAVAILGLGVASYRAWLAENTLRTELESAASGLTTMRDWSGDWKELADKFERYAAHRIRADWQHSSQGGNQWRVCGGSNDATRNCESLCKLAGALLLTSPGVSSELSMDIRSEQDKLLRWLYYLKEKVGLTSTQYALESVGEKKTVLVFGSISSLATVSATVCIECAASTFIQTK
jgi:hypothetical protein